MEMNKKSQNQVLMDHYPLRNFAENLKSNHKANQL
jgi:hypothetical protein